MKGDFSRQTFSPRRHFSGVRMQQGRVQLDADWNEQADITLHRDETAARDLVGPTGGPLDGAGFALTTGPVAGDFGVGRGRYYVDGVLCEHDGPGTTWLTQPDRPGVEPLSGTGYHLVYLDAWRRHVTALDDPSLRETALGGADTATRLKNVWQLRTVFLGPNPLPGLGAVPAYDAATAPPTGTMRARTRTVDEGDEPCIVPPGAGFRGLENQLYRVEIHDAGAAYEVDGGAAFDVVAIAAPDRVTVAAGGTWAVGDAVEVFSAAPDRDPVKGRLAHVVAVDGDALTLSAPAADLALADRPRVRRVGATWKWSRDNGIVVTAVKKIRGADVEVAEFGPDAVLDFLPGQWVEITDDARELEGRPGFLALVDKRNDATRTLTLRTVPGTLAPGPDGVDAALHPRIRRWDGVAAVKTRPPAGNEGFLELESGIEVRFHDGSYRPGDYWLIPARTATADARAGAIEWPLDGGVPAALAPHGIQHRYARLGVVRVTADGGVQPVEDCRSLFPAVTRLTQLRYVGGDGQEAFPGDALPRPLQAAVFNGDAPVAGARIRFVTMVGGRVGESVAATSNQHTAVTDGDGLATVHWTPAENPGNRVQQVTATLLDAVGQETDQLLRFTANHSHADRVRYDVPAPAGALDGQNTVQKAVDRLASLVSLHGLEGDGQVHVPGVDLAPLRVLAATPRGSATGVSVRFEVTDGGGTVRAGGGAAGTFVNVPVGADGTAAVTWVPDNDTRYQAVLATLVPGPGLAQAAPSQVRFTSTLAVGGEQEAGLRVEIVQVSGPSLRNDDVVSTEVLKKGIAIFFSEFPDARTLRAETVYLTLELPYPLSFSERNDWDLPLGTVVGHRPLVMAGTLTPNASTRGVTWRPTSAAADWLEDRVFPLLKEIAVNRVRARLTLAGNMIFADGADGIRRYLDGNHFGVLGGGTVQGILPSGDGRRGGDFEMWFYINEYVPPPPPPPYYYYYYRYGLSAGIGTRLV